MAYASRAIPEDSALLCEGCGYIVSGLPTASRCPECGKPVTESLPDTRRPPAWEGRAAGSVARFWRTTCQVIFQPREFFRTMTTRTGLSESRLFAMVHNAMACLLFGFAGFVQSEEVLQLMRLDDWAEWEVWLSTDPSRSAFYLVVGTSAFGAVAFAVLTLAVWLAARLTAWEAGMRGLRLPLSVAARGLHYHAAHYLPVALLAAVTVGTYHLLRHHRVIPITYESWYIYLLCGEVVAGAGYLFKTYWIGMRNMMFANR